MKPYLEHEYPPLADPAKFELMCQKLWAQEWRDSNVALHGRTGQKQMGVDVYGIDKSMRAANKEYSGIQSKKRSGKLFGKKDLTEKEIVKEVEDALKFDTGDSGNLAQLIIATTQSRDTKYQKLERKLTKEYEFDVHIKGWEDICHLLSKYQDVADEFYQNYAAPDDEELKALKVSAASGSNARLKLAKDYLDQGDCDSGLKVLQSIESDGLGGLTVEEEFKVYSNSAVAYSMKGDNTNVLRYLDKAHATNTQNEIWYRNRSSVLLFQENFNAALTNIDTALAKFDSASLKSMRAEILFRQGKKPKAIIDEYEQLSKTNEELAYRLALIAGQSSMREKAIQLLEHHKDTSIKNFSFEHVQSMAYLGSLYIEDITAKNNYLLGHFDDQSLERKDLGKELLDYVIETIGDRQIKSLFADVFSRRSVFHGMSGDTFEAIADAKQAYLLDPTNDQSAANYAMQLMENKKTTEAHGVLQRDPDNLGHIFLDAMVYGSEDNFSEESVCFEKVIEAGEKNEQRIVAYNAYVQSLISQKKYDEAMLLVDRYEEAFTVCAESLHYRAIIAQKTGEQVEVVVDYLSKAASAITENTLNEAIAGIGSRLEDYKQHDKAIEVLEKIVSTNTYDIILEKYLLALWNERRLTDAERLCKEAVQKHGAKSLCIDILFNIAMQKSDFNEGVKLLEGIANKMESKEYSIKLALLYIENGKKQKAEEIISEINKANVTDDEALGIAQIYIELDRKKEAIETLYNAITKDANIAETQRAYVSTVLMNNDIDYSVTEKVTSNCAVTLQSSPKAPSRVIVIEGCKAQENIGQSRYFKDHSVSKQLIGKKVGDKVKIVDNEYVIESVTSKYLHLFAHCRDTFSENFPEHQFMWKVKVVDEEGNFDVTKIQENLSQQEKRGKQIHENVEKALFPFSAAAVLSGKSYLDLMYAYIASPELALPSSTLQDFPDKLPKVLVLDLSVCISLCGSDIDLPEVEGTRFVIPNSSSKLISEKIKELEAKKGRGEDHSFAYTDNGKLRIKNTSEDALLEHIEVIKKLRKWIKVNVETIPLSKADTLTKQEYDKYEDILGNAWADVITEVKSHATEAILISEDLALRRLLASEIKGICTANSQQLLDHFRKSGLLTTDRYLEHLRYLVESGFIHSYVSADDLHQAFKVNAFKLDSNSQPYLDILTDHKVDTKPVIGVAINFLYKFWKSAGSQLYWDAVSGKVLHILIKRKDYQSNSELIELVINKVFYMIPNVAAELIQAKRNLDNL
jgi:tetratricopeptide (TPR) repeat protein